MQQQQQQAQQGQQALPFVGMNENQTPDLSEMLVTNSGGGNFINPNEGIQPMKLNVPNGTANGNMDITKNSALNGNNRFGIIETDWLSLMGAGPGFG